MAIEYKQWQEILSAVNDDTSLNHDNVIEKITQRLPKCEHNEGERVKINVNHTFLIIYDYGLRGKTVDECTLLLLAIRNNLENVVGALLNVEEINVNELSSVPFWTVLHYAATFNSDKVIDVLLQSGKTDVNARSHGECTPLHVAASYKSNKAIIALLRVKGIEVNAKNKDNKTPLHMIVSGNCDEEAIRKLIEAGANVNEKDNEGKTPLHRSVSVKTIEILVENGANIKEVDEDKNTTLHLATSYYFCEEVIEILIKKGADINAKNKYGQTTLHLAAKSGKTNVVKLLINNGASVDEKDNEGKTPLHYSVENCKTHIVKALINKKASVNEKDNNGQTSLHLAAIHCRISKTQILINAGAGIYAKDNNDRTPLWYANGDVKDILIAAHNEQVGTKSFIAAEVLNTTAMGIVFTTGYDNMYETFKPNTEIKDPEPSMLNRIMQFLCSCKV